MAATATYTSLAMQNPPRSVPKGIRIPNPCFSDICLDLRLFIHLRFVHSAEDFVGFVVPARIVTGMMPFLAILTRTTITHGSTSKQ